MSLTAIDGSPDDFYSWEAEMSASFEIDTIGDELREDIAAYERRMRGRRPIGKTAMKLAVFDISRPVMAPYFLKHDPYDRLTF